ncbi:MAG: hypothetical protein JO316_02965 [Abitibacteriaceae bacterium]|nr:hypothetical protein [Abditibacteriaceae bacterium]MBV9864291.1 hypothetical protein [Abditibacteriaceae bacterium]
MNKDVNGLYYPFIHFRNEAWLKRAALYWDQMARIVPPHDFPRDSDTVSALKYKAGFILDERPHNAADNVGEKFLKLLQDYEQPLLRRYAIKKDRRKLHPSELYRGHAVRDSNIVEVYYGKMPTRLRQAFTDTGLASPDDYGEVLKMHHQLAGVYMTALANEMARGNYQPVTDNPLHHYALMGDTVEHIAEALLPSKRSLQKKNQPSGTMGGDVVQVAMFAIETVIPRDIETLSVDEIIHFRKEHKDAMRHFRDNVEAFVQDQSLIKAASQDESKFQEALKRAYQAKIERHLNSLEAYFATLKKETVRTLIFVSPSACVTKGLPAIGLTLEPTSAFIGALAVSTYAVFQGKQKEAKKQVGPSIYLLHLKERFQPTDRRTSISRWARHFFFRV